MLSFVVVTYDDNIEQRLHSIQAKSFAYVDPKIIHKIYIIYNADDFETYKQRFYAEIIHCYPEYLFDKIVLLSRDYFLKSTSLRIGWFIQQSIKLLISKIIETEYYITLDAKDHFIQPIDYSYFFNESKPYFYIQHNNIIHSTKSNLKNAAAYFGIQIDININSKTVMLSKNGVSYCLIEPITPFVFKTDLVLDMINTIEKKENNNFEVVFLKHKFWEFFLYYCYLIHNNLVRDNYGFKQHINHKLWGKNSTIHGLYSENLYNNIISKNISCIGFHRDRVPNLTAHERITIFKFYQRIQPDFILDDIYNILDPYKYIK